MSYTQKFDYTERIYQDVCHQVAEPRNFFFTSTYIGLRQDAYAVSSHLTPLAEALVDLTLDEEAPPEFRPLNRIMNYRKLFLRSRKRRELSLAQYEQLRLSLDTTIHMGLLVHLLLVLSPGRKENYPWLDMDQLACSWVYRIPFLPRIIPRYDADVKKLPSAMFDAYYQDYVFPFVKNELKMKGYFAMKNQRRLFNQLFFSGVLLGLESDFACRQMQSHQS